MTPRQRDLVAAALRPVPTGVLVRAAGRAETPIGRLAKVGLRNRAVTVGQGVARGLTLDPGPSNPDYALGTNEPSVQAALTDLLQPGHVLYDVGANVGFLTLVGATLVGPAGAVCAFEPDLANAHLVRENALRNGLSQVLVVARAVGAATGAAQLQLADYAGGHALVGSGEPPDLRGLVPVEAVSLDDFVAQPGVRPPDVVKVDVEGGEAAVLDGMAAVLATTRPVLLIELDDADEAEHDVKLAEVRSRLDRAGYSMERLADAYPGNDWVITHWVCRPIGAATTSGPGAGRP
jgi:FkbM family methyltransferase